MLLAFPKPAEAQNWARYSGLSKLDAFFYQRDAEPVCARAFESARACDRAVTISVSLHGRHDGDTGATALPYAKL